MPEENIAVDKWLRFLREQEEQKEDNFVQKLKEDKGIDVDMLDKLFRVFHLSARDIRKNHEDKTAEFNPRVPSAVFNDHVGNNIEDDFTKRVSLAPTIENAVNALGRDTYNWCIFAGDIVNHSGDNIDTIKLAQQKFPVCKEKLNYTDDGFKIDYSRAKHQEFYFDRWVKQNDPADASVAEGPSDLPPEFRSLWQGCVPDAEETKEEWAIHDVYLYYVGKLRVNGTMAFFDDEASLQNVINAYNYYSQQSLQEGWDAEGYNVDKGKEFYTTDASGEFWGKKAAGLTLIAKDTGRVLLGLRSESVNEPLTWSNVGGAVDEGEDVEAGALREFSEETQGSLTGVKIVPAFVFRNKERTFEYHNFVGILPSERPFKAKSWEVDEVRWFSLSDIEKMKDKLHPGFQELLKHSGDLIRKYAR